MNYELLLGREEKIQRDYRLTDFFFVDEIEFVPIFWVVYEALISCHSFASLTRFLYGNECNP